MSDEIEVDLFGVVRQDDPSKVTEELGGFADGTDAVCLPFPSRAGSVKRYLELMLRAPVYFFGAMLLQTLLLSPLYLLQVRDLFPAEWVAGQRLRDRGVRVHNVGTSVNGRIRQCGSVTTLWNWLLLVPLVWLDPLAAAATAAYTLTSPIPTTLRRRGQRRPAIALAVALFVGAAVLFAMGLLSLWLVCVGAITYIVVANMKADWLHRETAENTVDVAAEHGYDAVTLVQSKNFLNPLADAVRERGFHLGRLYVSEQGAEGRAYESFDPDVLDDGDAPTVAGRLGDPDGPVLEYGSERTVAGRRALATLIDSVFAFLFVFVAFVLTHLSVGLAAGYTEDDVGMGVAAVVAVTTWLVYYAVAEWLTGTTGGKRALGLVVADADDGGVASGRQVLVRNLLRPVDALFYYGVGGLLMLATDRKQRLGDLAAGTVVGRYADDVTDTDDAADEREPTPPQPPTEDVHPGASAAERGADRGEGPHERAEAAGGGTASEADAPSNAGLWPDEAADGDREGATPEDDPDPGRADDGTDDESADDDVDRLPDAWQED